MHTKHTIDNGVTQENAETAHCPRCQGFLARVDFMDMLQGGYLWGTGQRCINCGHLMDPRILLNQLRHQARREARQRNHIITA